MVASWAACAVLRLILSQDGLRFVLRAITNRRRDLNLRLLRRRSRRAHPPVGRWVDHEAVEVQREGAVTVEQLTMDRRQRPLGNDASCPRDAGEPLVGIAASC